MVGDSWGLRLCTEAAEEQPQAAEEVVDAAAAAVLGPGGSGGGGTMSLPKEAKVLDGHGALLPAEGEGVVQNCSRGVSGGAALADVAASEATVPTAVGQPAPHGKSASERSDEAHLAAAKAIKAVEEHLETSKNEMVIGESAS